MKLPKLIELFNVPTQRPAEAQVTDLTNALIRHRMGTHWWDNSVIVQERATQEIDRYWDWAQVKIEWNGKILRSRKLAVITGDSAVQGASLISTEPVPCERELGQSALFVELLFAAPVNRQWIRNDKAEQYRGVGVALLRTAAEMSIEAGCEGRLKLDSSPGFVDWYKNRGLLEVSKQRILYEDVEYTPMELEKSRMSILLPEQKKGTRRERKAL